MAITYANMTVDQIYSAIHVPYYQDQDKPLLLRQEEGWVEAENIFAVRAIICEWFNAIEDGTANDRHPNPLNLEGPPGKIITKERADKFVEELEDDFLIEAKSYRCTNQGIDAGPGFDRLEPHARIAFMQAIWKLMLTTEQIEEEGARRFAARKTPEGKEESKSGPTPSTSIDYYWD